ncbi:MAG: amidohydrolase [Candidatus Methanomethylicia archaeon]
MNGNVITMSNFTQKAEAIAIIGNRIAFVGSNSKCREFIGSNTRVIDCKGMTILPGFIDVHNHLVSYGLKLDWIDLRNTFSINDLKKLVRKRIEEIGSGKWVFGYGWDQEKFSEKRYPLRYDLDEVSPENPVVLVRICSHICVVNTLALNIAGIDSNTISPKNGYIDRDSKGEPTGILMEEAMNLVMSKIPKPNINDLVTAIEKACFEAIRNGLTTIHVVSAQPDEIRAFQKLRREGKLHVRIILYVDQSMLKCLRELGIEYGFGDLFLKINGVKLFMDGSFGARTAALMEPYSDNPAVTGILCNVDDVKENVKLIHESNLQVALHAIGDRAVIEAIKIFKELNNVDLRRHRIEHASLLLPEVFSEVLRLGIVLTVQPSFTISDFWIVNRLGDERAKYVYPISSLISSGIKIAGGSDCPVENMSPLYQIYSAVTRGKYEGVKLYKYTESECVTVLDAIKLFTMNAAYAGFEEKIKGSIEPGKLADVIVLSENPLTTSPERIKDIKVCMTIIDGDIKYSCL